MIHYCRSKRDPVRFQLWPEMASAILVLALVLSLPLPSRASDIGVQNEGAILYDLHCASCHGSLEENHLPNRSASRIRSAIRFIPAMTSLRDMKDAELQAIAAVLVEPAEAER